jgi:hypothetical protein
MCMPTHAPGLHCTHMSAASGHWFKPLCLCCWCRPPSLLQVTVISRPPTQQAVIVASDGLWDVIDLQKAARLTETGLQHLPDDEHSIVVAPSVRASEALMQAALAAGTQDNITVAVVDLQAGRPRSHGAPQGSSSAAQLAFAPRLAAAAAAAAGLAPGDALTMDHMRQVQREHQRQEQDQSALAKQRLSQWLDEAAEHTGMS